VHKAFGMSEPVTITRELAHDLMSALTEVFHDTEWLEVIRMTSGDAVVVEEPSSDAEWLALAKKYDEPGLEKVLMLMRGLQEALER
jgi:predicted NAD-dependent protein-ADP-ribosyltransferase YbiA (DUF1768 family)